MIVMRCHFEDIVIIFLGNVVFDHCANFWPDLYNRRSTFLLHFAAQGLRVRFGCGYPSAGQFIIADFRRKYHEKISTAQYHTSYGGPVNRFAVDVNPGETMEFGEDAHRRNFISWKDRM